MSLLRLFLIVSAVLIFTITLVAINANGFNWPSVFFGDVLALNWRTQFNIDFLIHLILLATWIVWRERFTVKGYLFGFLSIFMGGMFGFLYILYASYKAKGDPRKLLMGERMNCEPRDGRT